MAITQKSRIRVRSGLQDDLPQLAAGELGWAVDTRRLYIGNGTIGEGSPSIGNTEILTVFSDISTIGINTATLVLSTAILANGIYSPSANIFAITSQFADVARFTNPTSTVNSLVFMGGQNNVGPTISSYGQVDQNINLTPNGTGDIVITSGTLAINSLSPGHIVYTGTSGKLQATNLHFDGINLGLTTEPHVDWSSTISALQLHEISSIFTNRTDGTFIGTNTVVNSGGINKAIISGPGTMYESKNGEHRWFTYPTAAPGVTQVATSKMVLSSNNTLGIGVEPNVLPEGKSGLQLFSYMVESDDVGSTDMYNNAYELGTETKYLRATGATKYVMTPTVHRWHVSDGVAHIPGDTITWLSPALQINPDNNVYVGQDLNVAGNMNITGTMTYQTSTVVSIDDPTFNLGGAVATVEVLKDRGVEFKWGGAVIVVTQYVGNGSTTVVGEIDVTGFTDGDMITISGAVGTEESKLNGTWPIEILTGTTFRIIIDSSLAAGTYTTNIGTVVKSFNGFFGFDQSTQYFTVIPKSANAGKIFTGTKGDIEATNFRGALIGNATTATTLATSRTIYGNSFDGSANLTQIIAPQYGGTGSAYVSIAGPTALRTYTLPDASTTILTTNSVVSVAQGGTGVATITGLLYGNGTGPITAQSTTGTGAVVRATDATVGGTWAAGTPWILPAFSMNGTISGYGNELNNIIIGTDTPLAGYFTSLHASAASTFAAGTVGLPGVYFAADTTSGLYRIGANNIGVSISGANVLDVASTGLSVTGAVTVSTTLTVTGKTNVSAGTVGLPGVYFAADTTSGLYRIGANNIGVSISGANVLDVASTGLSVTGELSTTKKASFPAVSGVITGSINISAGTGNTAVEGDLYVSSGTPNTLRFHNGVGVKQVAYTDSEITSTMYIGTTSVALNRTPAAMALTGISSISANLVGDSPTLFNTTTTGTISIADALTTGTLNIANGGTGATTLNIGHTNSIIYITGSTTHYGRLTLSSALRIPSTSGYTASAGDIYNDLNQLKFHNGTSIKDVAFSDSTTYIGTTAISYIRPSGMLALTGISAIDAIYGTDTVTLHNAITTGSISIGGGLTTGTLNIATTGSGTTAINVGHTGSVISVIGNTTITGALTVTNKLTVPAASATISGSINIPQGAGNTPVTGDLYHATGKLYFHDGTSAKQLAFTTSPFYIGTTAVASTSAPQALTGISSIATNAITDNPELYSNVTTGTIYLGHGVTSGAVNIGASAGFGGSINIGSGASSLAKAINIGTNGTTTSTTINIGSAASNSITTIVSPLAVNTIRTTGATTSLTIGDSLTTGSVNIANGNTFNGTVNIAAGTTSTNKIINLGTGGASATTTVNIGGSVSGSVTTVNTPVTKFNGSVAVSASVNTSGAYTLPATVTYVSFTGAGSIDLTSNAEGRIAGRRIVIKTTTATAIAAAVAATVIPITGGAAGTDILPATAGKWAELVCNGTTWEIFAAN